ncbi:MAG: flagellar hook-associated protein FlgK [Phycisphaeraceae bacterium]
MSLTGALHLGRSALTASQTALQVTGNNLANAATEGYTRQKAIATPGTSQQIQPGTFVGTGVRIEQIARQVNEALNQRMRSADSDHHAALAQHDVLSQIESIQNDLGDAGLSQRLERFFESWSQVASNPTDDSLKGLVISEAKSLGEFVGQLRQDTVGIGEQVDAQLRSGVNTVNTLLERVAELNQQINRVEGGAGGAHSLRDERDRVLKEISQYVDISTVEQPAGTMDVFIGSTPIVLGMNSRGVKMDFQADGDTLTPRLRVATEGDILRPTSGKITQLMETRSQDVDHAVEQLDTLAHQLIYQVNQLHSSGQAERGFEQLTSVHGMEDTAAALDQAGLPFEVRNGSFMVHVTQPSGQRTAHRIEVDLGNSAAGTSMDDIAAAIDSVDMLNASLTVDGRLNIAGASSDVRVSFSEDTSGLLAAAGLNTFFTGTNASDMGVNEHLADTPANLAIAQGHVQGDNRTAKAVADLLNKPLDALGGASLRGHWSHHVESYASRAGHAQQQVEATGMISESLQSQWQSHSGVNVDEEAIDMLSWQRSFQGAARFIGVVDQMMQTLLTMTR